MTKAEFISKVILVMNEGGLFDVNGNSLLGADTTQIDRHIEGSFVDAWRRCAQVMPRVWFENRAFNESEIIPDLPQGTGYVVLPDDFFMIVSFKMNGWKKSVYEASINNELTASIQANEYTRGSQLRPVCTISNKLINNAQIKPVLNYFSLPKGIEEHTIEEAIYIPVTRPLKDFGDDEDLLVNDQLIDPLAYLSAATVFTIFEKYDISKTLEQRAIEMFPGLQSIRGKNTVTIKQ